MKYDDFINEFDKGEYISKKKVIKLLEIFNGEEEPLYAQF